jgi:hypothetical protein
LLALPRRKQVCKITYPNGKIYVGMDLSGSLLYIGSPSVSEQIVADLEAHGLDLTLRKEHSHRADGYTTMPTSRFSGEHIDGLQRTALRD